MATAAFVLIVLWGVLILFSTGDVKHVGALRLSYTISALLMAFGLLGLVL